MMLAELPNEDVVIQTGDAEYVICVDWIGVHEIVSECGWWIGQAKVVQEEGKRYLEWLYAYSINFDEE